MCGQLGKIFQVTAVAVNDLIMVEVLDGDKVLGYLSGYFEMLANAGSVSPATSMDFVRYLFLVDFVDTMYGFLTEADYTEIEALLSELFSKGHCLLSYPVFCSRRISIGKAKLDTGNLRITEDVSELRITEDEKLRGI